MNVRRTQRRPTIRGFTLMEVILALAVAAIVLVALQTVFFGALKLRDTTARDAEESTELRQAVAVIRRDLTDLVGTGGVFFAGLQTTATPSTLGPAEAERASPDFYTATGPVDARSTFADVQCITYGLQGASGSDAARTLVRLVNRNLLPVQAQTPAIETLLHGVRALTFAYYDGSAWTTSWDSTATGTMPVAIRVHLELLRHAAEAGGPATVVELFVPVAVGTPVT